MKITLDEKVLSYLLVNYNCILGLGLLHGKMGGVLFFILYSRYTKCDIYEEYADMLMKDIYNKIYDDISINFEIGLCGIGWCIEYLVHNKLINGNTDEILYEIDQKVMCLDPSRIDDYSMKTGFGGILMYINARIKSFEREMPFDLDYLTVVKKRIKSIVPKNDLLKGYIDEFEMMISGNIDYNSHWDFPNFIFGELPIITDKVSNYPLGIHNGLTGVMLKKIIK